MTGTSRRYVRRALAGLTALLMMLASLVGITVATAPPAAAASDSLGTDYWLTFMENGGSPPELTLFITGPTATSGTVEVPGLSFSTPFTVTPGAVTSVVLPAGAHITSSDLVEDLGVHVTAADEITVYGLNRFTASTDAFLGLPTDILGTEYIVQGYRNSNILNGSEFAVVATQNATTVTIVPTVTTGPRLAGVPYTVALDQGQTYQLQNTDAAPADLSGTIVTADQPIGVFGGHLCANIPAGVTACDHIVEQMTPTVTWGRSFVTEPLATRNGGDTFRYLASTDDTVVSVNGVVVATLDRGQLFEQMLTAASTITSDKPILVTQYSNGTSFDGVTSDPFEVIVPPFEQFLNNYTVTTPASGFAINFINVVAPTASVGSVTLDGAPIPAESFAAIPGSTFSGAQVSVTVGSHTLGGPQPFGITVYGFAQADSYGYPGGLSLAPVASVTNVALAPATSTGPVDTQHCVTATVTDQNAAPVVGVRVDFTVTGTNPTSGFANTSEAGTSEFCYTGTVAGPDSIQAAVGTVTATASRTWTAVDPTLFTLDVSVEGSGSVSSDPAGIDCGDICSAAFADGASVELTATPSEGSTFSGWGGACEGTGACVVNLTANASVTATFAVIPPPDGDLGVTEVSEPETVTAGQNVRQTFTVTNGGEGDQTNVSFTASFPAGSIVVSSDPSQGSCTAGPATLTCSLGTIGSGGSVTIPAVVTVPGGFPPGVFAPTASATSDQSSGEFGDLPGSEVVAPSGGQALGFVAPGETLTTGEATPENPTAASFTLPGTGPGVPIALIAEPTTPTYCGGLPCRGNLMFLSPFEGGYDDPNNPPMLDLSLDASVVAEFGPSYGVWVQKEDPNVAPTLVPDCAKVTTWEKHKVKMKTWYPVKVWKKTKWGKGYWHTEWKWKWVWKWKWEKTVTSIAVPSPCVAKRFIDAQGDSHVEILVLSGDPKFGRR